MPEPKWPTPPTENKKQELQKNVEGFLTLPDRRDGGNPDKDLAKKLGAFLVNKG